MSLINKQDRLDQIAADIVSQNICPDLAKTAKHLVVGTGSPESDIVFIGEAPGKKEDESGEPFVGAAGRFLDEMLASINLKRSDVFITNIVKYRPPDNRDPFPEEKKAFLPYLQAQLEIIQPKIVVTLGRHSTNCFLPDLQISKIHGEPQRITLATKQHAGDVLEIVLLPLYHPAAALYNGGMRATLLEDFSQIPAIIHEITSITDQ